MSAPMRTRNGSGFTLLELLVAVTVIAILLAILTPALEHVMSRAERVACAANLHSIGVGALQYVMDFKVIPQRAGQPGQPEGDGYENGYRAGGGHGDQSDPVTDVQRPLHRYAGPGAFHCPSDVGAKATGANRWKVDRQPRVSWSSPVVSRSNGCEEIIVSSNGVVEAYDASNGQRLWMLDGFSGNTVASPSVAEDVVVVGSSENGSNVCIGRPTRAGEARVKWRAEGALAGFASPLIRAGNVYYVNKAGVVTCIGLHAGETRWTFRLPSSCWASPIAAGNLIYFFCKDGQTVVIRSDEPKPTKVAESSIPVDGRVYGVAAVDGAFIIRTGQRLIKIGPSVASAQSRAARTAMLAGDGQKRWKIESAVLQGHEQPANGVISTMKSDGTWTDTHGLSGGWRIDGEDIVYDYTRYGLSVRCRIVELTPKRLVVEFHDLVPGMKMTLAAVD